MQGLEIAQAYFEEYGLPMLQEQFPDILPCLSAGLFGSGSECYGYDDAVSRDHDLEPGFCLFLPPEDVVDRQQAFLLEKAYARLPREYRGLQRSFQQPVGGARHGVFRMGDYFQSRIGSGTGELSLNEWLTIPETALSEMTNGRVFLDNSGELRKIRQRLQFFPRNVFLKKLAGHLLLASQAGQYNYLRCIHHGEQAAAQLAAFEFVDHCMEIIFLLNRVYRPFYKWQFRMLRSLPELSLEAEVMEYLLTTGNEAPGYQEKYEAMESIMGDILDTLTDRQLTDVRCHDAEKHAYAVNDRITDAALRNRHILAAV